MNTEIVSLLSANVSIHSSVSIENVEQPGLTRQFRTPFSERRLDGKKGSGDFPPQILLIGG